MAGGATAVTNGQSLQDKVCEIARGLGLSVTTQVPVGRRIWGAERRIDVILTDRVSRRSLGVECKYQGSRGSAEEKIPAVLDDMNFWPIRGMLVFAGPGFSRNLRQFLYSSGKAVELDDFENWVRLYFGLPLDSDELS